MCIDKEQVKYSGYFDILDTGLFHIVICFQTLDYIIEGKLSDDVTYSDDPGVHA